MNVTNYVAGEHVPAASGAWLDKVAPATGEVIARVADSDARDVEAAVAAAVRAISPWNLPLYLFTWKIAPALATGNTVVAKPSELTPQTAWMLTAMAKEVGFPPGVLNVVHGLGHKVGAALVAHPKVTTISFTGGTVTGAEVARTAAPMFKKVALELGGKNPNLVFADADLDEAVPMSLRPS